MTAPKSVKCELCGQDPESENQMFLKLAERTEFMWKARAERDRALAKLERATKALKSCKAAMDYAYEDRVDQYYLNMKEDIEKALAEIGQEVKE